MLLSHCLSISYFFIFVMMRCGNIGVDLGGSPGTCPPIIEKRTCIYHFFHLSPNILVCPLNIFDKSMPVCGKFPIDGDRECPICLTEIKSWFDHLSMQCNIFSLVRQ